MFAAMTGLAMFAKPGAALRYGVPLGGGLLMLMAVGVGGMFVPVTSAWYPILHNVYLYGGLTLFTLYIAYDTQKMIDEYEMGEDDHIKHATDLFIDFKIVFSRVLQLLMMSRDGWRDIILSDFCSLSDLSKIKVLLGSLKESVESRSSKLERKC